MKVGRGFTLIELLVVLSIIALLLSIAMPRYFASIDKSREQVLKENLSILRQSIDRFNADKGHYPATLDELVTEKYLKSVPVDPVTESAQSWKPIAGEGADQQGIVDVYSGASGNSRDGTPFASF
jgi:general secretion pathway protein G